MNGLRDLLRSNLFPSRRDPTIRSRVISLIAIVLLPLLILLAWVALRYATVQRQVIEVERVYIASSLTDLLDREIAGIRGVLTGLGASEDLSIGDFDRFSRNALAVSRLPSYSAIRVFDPGGAVIFSTLGAADPAPPARDRANVINQVFRGRVVVTDLHDTAEGNSNFFSVIIPVEKNGSIAYALAADISASRMKALFSEAGLKQDWIAAIVDHTGRFVARSLHPDDYIGKKARPELADAAAGAVTVGVFENVTLEGTRTVNSFQRSVFTGWTSVVAVPKDVLNAPFRRSMIYVLFGGATLSLLSVALASLMAAQISEPVRRLKLAATALVEGRALPETPHRIAELAEVRAAFEHAVAKSAHLAAIVASSGDAIMSIGLDGKIRSWNQGAEKLFGYTSDEMIGRPKTVLIPDSRLQEFDQNIALVSSGQSARSETVRKARDGSLLEVSLDMAPLRDSEDKIVAISSIIHDITNRKRTEKHQRFLMRELTHRSKNLLAIVQSMARQTARSSPSLKEFETQYMQRLQGLAASHDLLVNQDWVGAPLDELIRKQVEAFVEQNRSNLAVSGPHVIISSRAAQTIGLALHELATNSIKYGALSTPSGKVSIEWEYQFAAGVLASLLLKWEEHNGPPVLPPSRKGFGHFVIERMVTQSLNAKVKIEFLPQGLVWILDVPIDMLENEPEFDSGERPIEA
jgi:PAS domain S-box-containing protein